MYRSILTFGTQSHYSVKALGDLKKPFASTAFVSRAVY
jgi:hypothetical protein